MMDLDNMSTDDFLKGNEKPIPNSLEDRMSDERVQWTEKIAYMSNMMNDVYKLSTLMTEIYTERQRAVEYYHYLVTKMSTINKIYRRQWSEKYDHYTYKSQKRFPNEKLKELQILSEMEDIVSKRDALDNHMKFINSTIGTIDNLIYGIKYKVELEQLIRGK